VIGETPGPSERGERKEPHLPYLIEHAGLSSESTVLDIGCGAGKLADELAAYLSPSGAYVGMDVRAGPLRKASRRHQARPNFTFRHADLRNRRYNDEGAGDARSYRFPAGDASVDVVVLRSVFTHMLPPEIEHYVDEIARVLRPGGTAYVTAYLLNEESSAFVEGRSADQPGSFPHDRGDHRVRFEGVPEHAVALAEDLVRGVFAERGLSIREPILYGSWCGRTDFLTRQDVVVAER